MKFTKGLIVAYLLPHRVHGGHFTTYKANNYYYYYCHYTSQSLRLDQKRIVWLTQELYYSYYLQNRTKLALGPIIL